MNKLLTLSAVAVSTLLSSCLIVVPPVTNPNPGGNPTPPVTDYSKKKLKYSVDSITIYSLPKNKGKLKAYWDAPGAFSQFDRRYPDIYVTGSTKKSGRLFKTTTKTDHNPDSHVTLKAPAKFVDWSANSSINLKFLDNDNKKDDTMGSFSGFWVPKAGHGKTSGSKIHKHGAIHWKVNFTYRWVNK